MRIYDKKFLLLLFVIMLSLLSIEYSSKAAELPQKPNSEIYFQDYGGIFSADTKNYILKTSEDVKNKTTAEVAVVTINSLDDDSIENYANNLFRSWGIGNKEKNNGVLILISKEDRKFRIEVGYGLEGAIPDGKAGTYLRELTTYFKSEQYDEGIKTLYNRIIGDIGQEYDVDFSSYTQNTPELSSSSTDSGNDSIPVEAIIGIVIFVLLVGSSFIGKGGPGGRGGRKRRYNDDSFWGGGFYGGGFGGFGGGSSGDSGGGGSFGDFGGGDSGGGGSSGGW